MLRPRRTPIMNTNLEVARVLRNFEEAWEAYVVARDSQEYDPKVVDAAWKRANRAIKAFDVMVSKLA